MNACQRRALRREWSRRLGEPVTFEEAAECRSAARHAIRRARYALGPKNGRWRDCGMCHGTGQRAGYHGISECNTCWGAGCLHTSERGYINRPDPTHEAHCALMELRQRWVPPVDDPNEVPF